MRIIFPSSEVDQIDTMKKIKKKLKIKLLLSRKRESCFGLVEKKKKNEIVIYRF